MSFSLAPLVLFSCGCCRSLPLCGVCHDAFGRLSLWPQPSGFAPPFSCVALNFGEGVPGLLALLTLVHRVSGGSSAIGRGGGWPQIELTAQPAR